MPAIDRAALDARVEKVYDQVVAWRRYLHENPDLSFQEAPTVDYILGELKKMDPEGKHLKIDRIMPNALVVDLKGGAGEGPIIALRADIDALPVKELTPVPFSSKKEGVMHACGHDTHTAMLLGAIQLLIEDAAKIKGTARFFFQPAEELAPGGASGMVEKGCMEGVKMVFGQHILPLKNFHSGKVYVRRGAFLRSADSLEMEIIGRGGHASMPEFTVDPVAIACSVVTTLQQVVSRKMPSAKAPVLTIATILSSSDSFNVIPDKVVLKGSLRCGDRKVEEDSMRWVKEIATSIAEGMGGKCVCNWRHGYDVTMNDDSAYDVSMSVLEQIMPSKDDIVYMVDCMAASEDFSEFSNVAPGNYLGIGSYNEATGCTYANHNPNFKIDEDVMKIGVKVHYGHIHELLMQ